MSIKHQVYGVILVPTYKEKVPKVRERERAQVGSKENWKVENCEGFIRALERDILRVECNLPIILDTGQFGNLNF